LVAEITYDNSATVVDTRFYQGLIQTVERLTYTQVQSFLDGKEDAVTEPARQPLRDAFVLYQKLDKNRKDRGVLDFDLPECKVQLNDTGFPLRIFQAERVAAHKLIEEFMIAANQEVARALREADAPALYRVHDAPDAEALDDSQSIASDARHQEESDQAHPQSFLRSASRNGGIKNSWHTAHKHLETAETGQVHSRTPWTLWFGAIRLRTLYFP
jgi:ribonuclease R